MRGGRQGFVLSLLILSAGCGGGEMPPAARTTPLAVTDCPRSPNCVSSKARRPAQRVEPFRLARPLEEAWPRIEALVADMPRTEIVRRQGYALHALCKSAIFRFTDDLILAAEGDVIHLRSASRLGYSDFGVNRARIEDLRRRLVQEGLVEAP